MSVKTRNWNAVDAHFRNSAGPMKDKRSSRGGGKNRNRDFINDWIDDCLLETEEGDNMVAGDSVSDFVSHIHIRDE